MFFRRRSVQIAMSLVLVVLAPLGWHAWTMWRPPQVPDRYRTSTATIGDVTTVVVANGTLNPVAVVSVGTQVSGTIRRLYVDFNDRVRKGQLLAELDPAVYQAAVSQSRASLASAEGGLQLALATENRQKAVFARHLIAQQDLDLAIQNRVAAQAQKRVIEAQLSRDLSNLGYTKIYASVSGVILSRDVTVGQTVAASFQTPTLFKIAGDLIGMQIECRVPEADIGAVREGQRATFAVDAFPGRQFTGRLRQVRFNPKISDNVVTYSAIIEVANAGGYLMPGMTALVDIVTAERRNVLRVPAAALKFRPPSSGAGNDEGDVVYVTDGERLHAVKIRVGLSDGEFSEVVEGGLKVGTAVVIAEKSAPG